MKGLSPRQKQVLEILENAVRQGEHLTVREIGDQIGVTSTCTVHQHLKALERKGYVKSSNNKHRSIRLTSPPRTFVPVPFGGQAAAGEPVTATAAVGKTLLLPPDLVGQEDGVLFQVCGNSLTGAAICDGDLVVVCPGEEARDGDAVVAKAGNEMVIKQVVREDGRIYLHANTSVEKLAGEPVEADGDSIVGRVSLVIRRL